RRCTANTSIFRSPTNWCFSRPSQAAKSSAPAAASRAGRGASSTSVPATRPIPSTIRRKCAESSRTPSPGHILPQKQGTPRPPASTRPSAGSSKVKIHQRHGGVPVLDNREPGRLITHASYLIPHALNDLHGHQDAEVVGGERGLL